MRLFALTGEQQDENEGKQVRVLRQHSPRHLHGHGGFEEARDLLLHQVIEGGAPRSRHAGRTCVTRHRGHRLNWDTTQWVCVRRPPTYL